MPIQENPHAFRCPHTHCTIPPPGEGVLYDNTAQQYDFTQHFNRLADRAMSVLQRLRPNQLDSFSWDLGVCASPAVLGKDGELARNQSSLRSLDITTNSTCWDFWGFMGPSCHVDLADFPHLRRLRWRAPNPGNLDALADALRLNRAHLRELELDLTCWRRMLEYFQKRPQGGAPSEPSFFPEQILRRQPTSPQPYLAQLHTLSLSNVPLGAAMALEVNFATLRRLTLRKCPLSHAFLERVVQLRLPLRLRRLEFQEAGSDDGRAVRLLLGAFTGLQDLCVSETGSVDALELWELAARHHGASLQRLVYQRRFEPNHEASLFETTGDTQVLHGNEVDKLHLENPLALLDLELIALACRPESLERILQPFKERKSLKGIHIRQSFTEQAEFGSWALKDGSLATTSESDAGVNPNPPSATGPGNGDAASLTPASDPETSSQDASLSSQGEETHYEGWTTEFRQFATWVFGPDGIASVQFVVYGDYSHDQRWSARNLLLYRIAGQDEQFRGSEYSWCDALDQYRAELSAAPPEPLLDGELY
ncbi:hypothetical protein PWT90_10460 [Aphanocladium album]|nr:hypothetical protein PWT90_10460 [Aphanocladium album]